MLVLSDSRTRWPTFLLLLLLFLLLLKLAIETSRCIVHSTFSPLVLVNEWKAIEPVLVLVLVVGRRRRRRISDTAACRQSFGSCQPVRTDIICANQLLYFDILRAQVFQHSPHSPLSSSPAAPNTCSVSVTDWYCYYYYFIKLPGDDGTGGTGGCCSFSLAHHRTYCTACTACVGISVTAAAAKWLSC